MLAIEVAKNADDEEEEKAEEKKEGEDEFCQTELDEEGTPIAAQVEKVVELAQDKPEFRNVPITVLQMLENAPSVRQDDEAKKASAQQDENQQIEQLIFGGSEGCMLKSELGYLMAWSCLLKKIDQGRIKAQLQNRDDYLAVIQCITEYLEQNPEIYQMLLVLLLQYLPYVKKPDVTLDELLSFDPSRIELDEPVSAQLMSLFTLASFMKSFPSLARKYYQDCDKRLKDIIVLYLKHIVSPAIFEHEIAKIETSQVTLNEAG
jgi:hypothetical protein